MSTQPTIYDTTNADQTNLMQMSQLVAQDMRAGNAYQITGPQASYVQNYATGLSGVTVQPEPSPSNSTDWLSTIGSGGASGFATGPAEQAAAAGASTPSQAAAGGGYNAANANMGPTSTTGVTGWLQSHLANYGLVVMGALLVLGALLISQRDNIAKVAAVTAV